MTRSRIVAVSVLTSMDASTLAEIGVNDSPADSVMRLVKLAEAAGVDGVVSSANEAARIRTLTTRGFLIVTPGIRPASGAEEDKTEDQKRVTTAALALNAGADYLVVGRPITSASDPVAAAHEILAEMHST
jgi:orotidine-5'-phosphate decarboxylase